MIERGGGFAGTLAHGVRHDLLLVGGGAEHQVGAERQQRRHNDQDQAEDMGADGEARGGDGAQPPRPRLTGHGESAGCHCLPHECLLAVVPAAFHCPWRTEKGRRGSLPAARFVRLRRTQKFTTLPIRKPWPLMLLFRFAPAAVPTAPVTKLLALWV